MIVLFNTNKERKIRKELNIWYSLIKRLVLLVGRVSPLRAVNGRLQGPTRTEWWAPPSRSVCGVKQISGCNFIALLLGLRTFRWGLGEKASPLKREERMQNSPPTPALTAPTAARGRIKIRSLA